MPKYHVRVLFYAPVDLTALVHVCQTEKSGVDRALNLFATTLPVKAACWVRNTVAARGGGGHVHYHELVLNRSSTTVFFP